MPEEPEQRSGLQAPHDPHGHRLVRVHIDQRPYESPNPTTGEALYALGNVPAGYELYREVQGDREDGSIGNNGKHVHIQENEHFHSTETRPKEYILVVNARQKVWGAEEISYDQVIALAYDTPPTGPTMIYAVIYHKGPGHTPEGTLSAGQSVEVKNGMIFDVTPTNRS